MTATKVNKNVVRIFNSIQFSLALIVSTILVGNANGQSPKITVYGAIRDKWIAMGAGNGTLRQPVTNEQSTFDNVGRWQQFQGGMISWHAETGAHVVWGLIGEHWLRLGREKFGYPITDELPTSNGRGLYNHFRALHLSNRPDASIFWSKHTGAHAVYGAIRDRWAKLGWERSRLGFPTSDEYSVQGAGANDRRTDFENGYILWSPRTGAREHITRVPFDEGTALNPVNE